MSNIQTLRKHYDQLNPRERFAALLDAGLRDDENERDALLNSSPRYNYTMSSHTLFAGAIETLAALHMCSMLNSGFTFQLVHRGVDTLESLIEHKSDQEAEQLEKRANFMYEGMTEIADQVITLDTAWRKFCEGEGVDPDKLLSRLPGGVDPAGGPSAYSLIMDMARILAKAEIDQAKVNELIESDKNLLHMMGGNA